MLQTRMHANDAYIQTYVQTCLHIRMYVQVYLSKYVVCISMHVLHVLCTYWLVPSGTGFSGVSSVIVASCGSG